MKFISYLVLTSLMIFVSACANLSAVSTGRSTFEGGFTVDVSGTWNQFERGVGDNVKTWTRDGLYIDALRFFPGIGDGKEVAEFNVQQEGQAKLIFKSIMSERAIIGLFEQYFSRDGSVFTTTSIAPAKFIQTDGIRFEFELIRKADGVRLTGTGWFAKTDSKLYAVVFTAPKLGFYQNQIPDVVNMAGTARVLASRN